jgi:peptide/nickel transport system permease protein
MAVTAPGVDAVTPQEPVAGSDVPESRRLRMSLLSNRKAVVGLAILSVFILISIIGTWIAPYDPSARSVDILQGPSAKHWFGTTHLGQDIFSQVLDGTRSVMFVGFFAGVVATVVAVLFGVSSGYLGGASGEGLSAVSNVFLVIPALPLIIIITTAIPNGGDWVVALVIGLTSWAWGARVLRAQTLSLRRRDFVEAARATGEPAWRIIVFEIMPNLTAIIVSSFVGTVIYAVMTEVALAFIGVQGLYAWNWGAILYWAQSEEALAIGAWWWFVPAGLAIALLGTALSLLNFGIDELVNPRLRSSGGSRVRDYTGRKVRMRVGFTPVLAHEGAGGANGAVPNGHGPGVRGEDALEVVDVHGEEGAR